jgi:glycine cleavage system aminomethyltransferase T/glycine/D-amino acid oxidase-like deaminating enzyme
MDTALTLPERASVVVIGGGIIGVSTLYHLAKRGVTDAVLLERKKLGSGTTWHAAGIVGQLRESSAQTELSKYSVQLFNELEIETGQATGYKQNGTINLALTDVRMEQLARNHDHAKRMNIATNLLSVEALGEMWPYIDYQGVLGGLQVPSNGQVNPLDVTQALAKGAKQHGARIFENVEATRLVTQHGKIIAVETPQGVIATEKVLLAGGMWSQRFAKQHGVTLPLQAAEHIYIVTEPIADLPRDLPCVVITEERAYWKEDAGKLLIGAFEEHGKAWGQKGIPASFEFDELPFDFDHMEPMLQTIFKRMPRLNDMGIKTFFCGPESFTPDGRPYLGPVPELQGLFVAAGMNSNGILMSGGTGLTMAEWMMDGLPARGMSALLASRAHPFQSNQRYLEERVTESLGLHYGLQWPGRQIKTARNIRRVPLHAQLKTEGALFAERIGWEVPMYFDAASPTWPTRASLGFQDWSPRVEEECLAARDAAIIVDQSMYGKILVQGRDAVKALNRVCGTEMDVTVGTSVYTQFLNQRGGIEADNTVTRLSAETFLVVTGHPSQIRDQAWIKRHAEPSWLFEVFDATSAYALISLHGPHCRAILQSLSSDDLSNTAFPFGAAREIDMAHARGWAIRRSFFGELGYELLIATEFAAHVFDNIIEAGRPHGMRPAGFFAMNSCRMEKAFRHFGHDLGEEDTPFETGLGFAVATEKQEAFLGQDVLRAQKQRGAATQHRTVAIALKQADLKDGPYLIHNETIWQDDVLVGHVTSGAWGYRVGRSLGLASLHRADGVSKIWIDAGGFEIMVAGRRHAIDVQLQPFYDPAGMRMRS